MFPLTAGDRRPHVPLTVWWGRGANCTKVLALVDTGTELTVLQGNPSKFAGPIVKIEGLGGRITKAVQQLTGAQQRYSPLEKNLLAAYTALLHVETITLQAPVSVRTDLPIAGWEWYLQERGGIQAGEIKELSKILNGLVTYKSLSHPNTCEIPVLQPSPIKSAPPYDNLTTEQKHDAWFTDGSAVLTHKGRRWTAVAYNPQQGKIVQEQGRGGSSQYAELVAIASLLEETDSQEIQIYTDSWAVYKACTTWMPTWRTNGWLIHGRPVWGGAELWEKIWVAAQTRLIQIGHVDAHVAANLDEENHNAVADELTRIRNVKASDPVDPVLLKMATWAHETGGNKATLEWARSRGMPITLGLVTTAQQVCEVCNEVNKWPLTTQTQGYLKKGTSAGQIWQLDYIGPLPKGRGGHLYCCTAVDTYTGLLQVLPCRSANQAATLKILQIIVMAYGMPSEIQTDNGTHFTGQLVQQWAQDSGIKWIFHIPYHPQAAELIERCNGLLKEQIRKLSPSKNANELGSGNYPSGNDIEQSTNRTVLPL
ncbi:DDE-type integrase transposase recombinase [Pelobates cultripes]|uniref:DDE-type integrase transposase recombinase n=1 Tax=Pelobates cultripes TaxID=61616 RepID=A0AAD1RRE6_PELCU|nr:DDE-type integrase transposase recombinase [Pelobates cultripes]